MSMAMALMTTVLPGAASLSAHAAGCRVPLVLRGTEVKRHGQPDSSLCIAAVAKKIAEGRSGSKRRRSMTGISSSGTCDAFTWRTAASKEEHVLAREPVASPRGSLLTMASSTSAGRLSSGEASVLRAGRGCAAGSGVRPLRTTCTQRFLASRSGGCLGPVVRRQLALVRKSLRYSSTLRVPRTLECTSMPIRLDAVSNHG